MYTPEWNIKIRKMIALDLIPNKNSVVNRLKQ